MSKLKKMQGIKVFCLQKGMTKKDALFSLACRMRGTQINGFTYDSITGKARVF